jgi:hypothetical protein
MRKVLAFALETKRHTRPAVHGAVKNFAAQV